MLKKLPNIDKTRRKRSSLQRSKDLNKEETNTQSEMVVVQSAQIPERFAQKTLLKLFQAKDETKFTNIIGVS